MIVFRVVGGFFGWLVVVEEWVCGWVGGGFKVGLWLLVAAFSSRYGFLGDRSVVVSVVVLAFGGF